MTPYTKPGRFPPAHTRYGAAKPVEVKFVEPEAAGQHDEDGRLLMTAPLAAPPRAPTTFMPRPSERAKVFMRPAGGPRPRPTFIPSPPCDRHPSGSGYPTPTPPPRPKSTTPLPPPSRAPESRLAGPTKTPNAPALPPQPRPRTNVVIMPDDIPY
ncbi:hypothetical protein WHZ77_05985 [Bradyrhizobium sp. A5]|uniref:hypothetical protein n=1 Tax=Bradyrhizobium sp. A5 TaxID=3133696 RepID=UPI003251F06A